MIGRKNIVVDQHNLYPYSCTGVARAPATCCDATQIMSTHATTSLPPCTDGSAYASLLTSHPAWAGGNTYLTRGSVVLGRQVLMILVLLRSLRAGGDRRS